MKGWPMWLFLAFLAVPLIEIALFIQVGGAIGLFPTLAIVILTAIVGSWLVRSQGSREMQNLRSSFSDLRDPSEPLANGAMILFSGALLLTPGFFTDIVGLALLTPPVRAAIFKWAKSRVNGAQFTMGPRPQQTSVPRDGVIDGDFEDITRDASDARSGWTRH